jgi:hypothetical protein
LNINRSASSGPIIGNQDLSINGIKSHPAFVAIKHSSFFSLIERVCGQTILFEHSVIFLSIFIDDGLQVKDTSLISLIAVRERVFAGGYLERVLHIYGTSIPGLYVLVLQEVLEFCHICRVRWQLLTFDVQIL